MCGCGDKLKVPRRRQINQEFFTPEQLAEMLRDVDLNRRRRGEEQVQMLTQRIEIADRLALMRRRDGEAELQAEMRMNAEEAEMPRGRAQGILRDSGIALTLAVILSLAMVKIVETITSWALSD